MKLEHYSAEQLRNEVLAMIGKSIDLKKYRVFFFGSRVVGRGSERSDVDVGIEGLEPIPVATWLQIQEEFENFPLLYKIEIVDFKRVAPIFREVALRHIE